MMMMVMVMMMMMVMIVYMIAAKRLQYHKRTKQITESTFVIRRSQKGHDAYTIIQYMMVTMMHIHT